MRLMAITPLLLLLAGADPPVRPNPNIKTSAWDVKHVVKPKSNPEPAFQPKGAGSVVYKEIPPTKGAVQIFLTTTPEVTDAANVLWLWPLEDENITVLDESNNQLVLEIPASPERSFSVRWSAKEPNRPRVSHVFKVKAGKGPQPPPDPVEPIDPPPSPNNPSPFKAPGLRAIYFYNDMQDPKSYPEDHYKIIYSQNYRDYLNRVMTDDKNAGGSKGYMILPYGTDMAQAAPLWRDAAATPADPEKKKLWLRAGNGTAGFDGPAPATIEENKKIFRALGAKE